MASRVKRIIQSPHQIKASCVFETKVFLQVNIGIYRHLLFKSAENAILERLEMVHCKCFS